MELRSSFEKIVDEVAQVARTMPWENRDFYTQWLAQQFFLVSHTPRLLCAYAIRVPLGSRAEFDHILHHLREETGHDSWILKDLQNLGTTPHNFRPHAAGAALIKSQYYQVQHENPLTLCGYSQFLEHLSVVVAGEIASRVERAFGPQTAVFLKGHAAVDVEHSEDGWKMLENISKDLEVRILENLEMSASLYLQMLGDLKSKSLGAPVPQVA
ncbi:MAG: iron-containing redox enzyme family protein [Proteobacteria bacterium]|nr:iron-containing redox enzyme family protein [Pseudomonadota bacterium]